MTTAKKKSTAKATTDAIDSAADNFDAAADMIKDGVDAAIKAGTEQAKAAQAFEGIEFPGRENFEAAVKAGEVYVAGVQELNGLFFKTAKEAVRFNTEAAKSFADCKSPEDVAQNQMKLAQSGFEAAVEAGTTFGQAYLKLASDLGAPFSNQFSAAYNDFVSKTAA